MTTNKDLGNFGENEGKKILLSSGYTILETNYFSRYGEIDIIAKKEDILVFVEVKTRKNNPLISPRESVNEKKQVRIKKTALLYMNDFKGDFFLRFDVIEIFVDEKRKEIKYNHLKDVF